MAFRQICVVKEVMLSESSDGMLSILGIRRIEGWQRSKTTFPLTYDPTAKSKLIHIIKFTLNRIFIIYN